MYARRWRRQFEHGVVSEWDDVTRRTVSPQETVEKHDRWLNPEGSGETELKKRTLTNLYNVRLTWLDLAHKTLDDAVLDAYAWPHDITDDQILERLLALNLARAAAVKGHS
jgi:hypothetical protein